MSKIITLAPLFRFAEYRLSNISQKELQGLFNAPVKKVIVKNVYLVRPRMRVLSSAVQSNRHLLLLKGSL